MSDIEPVKISDVEFDESVYPRFAIDEDSVKRYRDVLDDLPPIVLSADDRLIDGYHRLRAHQIEGKDQIDAERLPIDDDAKVYAEAVRRNATHGKQLTTDEKREAAREVYQRDGYTQADVAEILACSTGFVSNATRDLQQQEREDRREEAFNKYLNYVKYPTQEAVADSLGVDQATVDRDMQKFTDEELHNAPPDKPEITNVWRFNRCDPNYGVENYPGRIPGQIIENLLHYYTDEWDLVVDPMAGGGTTVDVCKSMARRFAAFDLNPLADKQINEADVTDGIPLDESVADFVFLDPPYWNLMDGQYIEGSASAEGYDDWLEVMATVAEETRRVLKSGGKAALLVMALEDETGDGQFRDLVVDCTEQYRDAGFSVKQRISAPIPTEVKSGRDVNFAKEHGRLLSINRDLVVYD